jgi:hypothetical protein
MLIVLTTLLGTLSPMVRSRAVLALENLALRHRIVVLQRSARKRPQLTPADRGSWRCPRSGGCITATNVGPPETLALLIISADDGRRHDPLPQEADTLPFPRRAKQSPTCRPRDAPFRSCFTSPFFAEIEFSVGTVLRSAGSPITPTGHSFCIPAIMVANSFLRFLWPTQNTSRC